jgi:hypothetical protein
MQVQPPNPSEISPRKKYICAACWVRMHTITELDARTGVITRKVASTCPLHVHELLESGPCQCKFHREFLLPTTSSETS